MTDPALADLLLEAITRTRDPHALAEQLQAIYAEWGRDVAIHVSGDRVDVSGGRDDDALTAELVWSDERRGWIRDAGDGPCAATALELSWIDEPERGVGEA